MTVSERKNIGNISTIADVLRRGFEDAELPCVVAAAATIDGPIFATALGRQNLETNDEMRTDTIIQIASMTKAIAGTCAMQLVEQGKLQLDSPISEVLPNLAKIQVLDGFDSGGEPKLRPPKRQITLRDLLTHTSGFTYAALNANIDRYIKKLSIPTFDSRLNASLNIPLAFDPGEKWEYGIGIDWAGKAVEAVSELTLGQYMKRNVLDPLGMNDTGFKVGESQRNRLARVYQRSTEGLKPINRDPPPNAEFESGGGGLYSTIEDYLKFTQMILHNGKFARQQILRPETVALMRKNSIGNVTVRALRAVVPEGTNPMEFIEGMKWGLSFLINPEPLPTGRSAGSLAWSGVINGYFWIDHANGVTGAFATQLLPFFDPKAVKLYDDFEAAVYRVIN